MSADYKDYIFNNSNDSIIICDTDGIIIECNPAGLKLFGLSLNQIIGMKMIDLYAIKSHAEMVIQQLSEHNVFKGEILNKTPEGKLFWSYLTANSLFNSDGEQIGTMGISRDVSEEKEMKKGFEIIVNDASDFIYSTNFKGEFTFLNEGLTKIGGYVPKKQLGKTFTDFLHPAWKDKISAYYETMFLEKIPNSYLEFEMICADGSALWVGQNVTTKFSETDPDKIEGFFGIVRDISKRKNTEKELKESEKRYRELFENSSDLIQEIDSNGKIIYVNQSWLRTLEYTLEEVEQLNLFELIHPDSQIHCQDLFANILQTGECHVERPNYYMISKNGNQIYVEGAITIKTGPDGSYRIQSFLRDLTKEKELSKLAETQRNEINQSIDYAKGIQKSALPTHDEINELLNEAFVFYRAKDKLSGDFYLVDQLKSNANEPLTAAIVADCTGHGVPGGILSLLCNALLKETFSNPLINSPAEALEFVRKKLIALFRNSEEREVQDGMDAAFCVINHQQNQIYFSGANLNCYIIRNNEVITLKGDRQHVGKNYISEAFTNHFFDILKGDRIYMFSDGYVDQFGGPDRRKFMKGRLLKFLLEIHQLKMEEQLQLLSTTFNEWKGNIEQTDDVTILGFKYE